jgi:hypothetical protein
MEQLLKDKPVVKKAWIKPEFAVHGKVSELTQAPPCPWREKRWGGTDGVTFAGITIPIHCSS